LTHHIGSHITSKDFAFQECVTKPIIVISELTIATQETAEQYKQVLAGETIFVNIKNRSAELLTRKPVILTTNMPIWRHIPTERDAFKNRVFLFDNLVMTNVIPKYIQYGAANHGYFQHMFKLIQTYSETMNIKPENLLNDSTLRELRPIPNAGENDQDPIDLYHEYGQHQSFDTTDDYIVITDDECDTSDPYNVETDVDSPLFRPKKNTQTTQTSTTATENSTQTEKLETPQPSSPSLLPGWTYVTPQDQIIDNPYTPLSQPKSPRKRLFFVDKPDPADIDMELAILHVLSPVYHSTPYDLIEYPIVNMIPSPIPQVEESIDIQSTTFMEPYQEEPESQVTRL
jgi:hypothetical protein